MKNLKLKFAFSVVYLLIAYTLTSCSQHKPIKELNDPQSLLELAQYSFQVASQSKNRSLILKHSKRGIEAAKRCNAIDKVFAPCHFYFALNTGLYYETRVLGYPTGIQLIYKKANRVIELDPHYENGGGYRLLGKLYLEVPSREIFGEHITRDVDKAIYYLGLAIQNGPDYPENHLFLAEALIEKGEFSHATQHLNNAWQLISKSSAPSHEQKQWKKLHQQLRKKVDHSES